ncbi:hypothetical protein MASR2M52_09770 [Pedobacter sp.]
MLGEWNIDVYRRSEIRSDGSEKITKDEKNVGHWRFYSNSSTKSIVDYDFSYTGSPAANITGGVIFISEEGKRMILQNFKCKGIGCDEAYTIQEFSGRKMVIEQYSPQTNTDQLVYKLRMELNKK